MECLLKGFPVVSGEDAHDEDIRREQERKDTFDLDIPLLRNKDIPDYSLETSMQRWKNCAETYSVYIVLGSSPFLSVFESCILYISF